MSFVKFAKAEVVEVRRSPSQIKTASLASFTTLGESVDEKLEDALEEGYLYLKARAISSRSNKNHDSWSSEELRNCYSTFLGKPYFVEHNNFDPRRARGVIIDASVHVDEDGKTASLDPFYSSTDSLPEHRPPTWVDCLVEIDARSFPKLARAILNGELDSVSMGCNVGYTKCSICDHKAEDAAEFCEHVRLKGARFDVENEDGTKTSRLAYERCFESSMFELSAVADPADETATMYQDTIRQASVADPADETALHKDKPSTKKAAVDPMTGQAKCSLCGSPTAGAEICDTCKGQQTPEQQAVVQADPLAQLQMQAKVITFKTDGAADEFLKAASEYEQTWDTGETILWIDNDESLYHAVRDAAWKGEVAVREVVKAWAEYAEGFNVDLDDVDWEAVAQHVDDDIDEGVESEAAQQPDVPQLKPSDYKGLPASESEAEALVRGAAVKQAERPKPPRSEEITAPPKGDPQEQDSICEVCGSDMDGESCEVCDWTIPPSGFDHPDLEKAQKVDEQMRGAEAEQDLAEQQIERVEDSKKKPAPKPDPRERQQARPGRPPARGASAGAVMSEKTANRGGDHGRINVREKPIMPPGERHSDKPLKAVTISDQHRPVESSKGSDMSKRKKQAIQTGADTQVDVTGVGAALTDVSPLKVVDVGAVGGIVAEGEAAKQDVAKDVDVVGGPTSTWSSGEDQESAVTDEKGENLQTVKGAAAVAGPTTPKPADVIDVNTPIGSEEVGDATDTWSSGEGQENPVTTETAELHQTVSSARRHAFACMKLAEAEIELGITDADDKYQRVAELEEEPLETVEAQIKTLAKVHTAGLRPAPQRRKVTASRMPSMRTASTLPPADMPDVENSFFL